jgi:hypothetical protein
MGARRRTAVSWPLCCLSEQFDGLDANDGRNDRVLKAAIAVAEKLFHRLGIEPAGNLLGGCHGEGGARNLCQATVPELVLEGFALGFSALQGRIGIAERVRESSVREIVGSGCGIDLGSLCHGHLRGLG